MDNRTAMPKTYPPDVASKLVSAMRGDKFWTDLPNLQRTAPGLAQTNEQNLNLNAPVPTSEQANAVLNASFFASLLEEEGRRSIFTLAFVSPSFVASSTDFEAFVFAKPVALHPKSIAKLTPATHPDRTFLGVFPNPSGELEIWGLVHRGERTFAIDLESPPSCLRIRVHRAGTMSGHYIGRLLFLYTRGEVHWFSEPWDLLGKLRDGAQMAPVVAHALCRLARRMLAHGHGGTLLVTNAGTARQGLTFHPSYQAASEILAEAVANDDAETTGSLPKVTLAEAATRRSRLEQRHADALAFVAQLTAVDGATVLDDRLSLLGFGAVIQTTGSSDDIIVKLENVYTGETRTTNLSEFPGTRHRSAIHFCLNQTTGLGLALVASQDGDLSVFARANESRTVLAFRSFELGIGM
jgi:hypothetical protein